MSLVVLRYVLYACPRLCCIHTKRGPTYLLAINYLEVYFGPIDHPLKDAGWFHSFSIGILISGRLVHLVTFDVSHNHLEHVPHGMIYYIS